MKSFFVDSAGSSMCGQFFKNTAFRNSEGLTARSALVTFFFAARVLHCSLARLAKKPKGVEWWPVATLIVVSINWNPFSVQHFLRILFRLFCETDGFAITPPASTCCGVSVRFHVANFRVPHDVLPIRYTECTEMARRRHLTHSADSHRQVYHQQVLKIFRLLLRRSPTLSTEVRNDPWKFRSQQH